MKITALDLGVQTGIAFGSSSRPPHLETWNLRAPDLGVRGFSLYRQLNEHLEWYQPDRLYVEKPMGLRTMMKIGSNEGVLQSMYAYNGIALMLGAKHEIATFLIDVQIVRRHFLGYRPKAGDGKARVIEWCRTLGWAPADNNQADAAALWDYACALEDSTIYLQERLKRSVGLTPA